MGSTCIRPPRLGRTRLAASLSCATRGNRARTSGSRHHRRPKEIVRITITAAEAEAPTLLAIRAADVLRASLRDFRGLVLPLSPAAAAEVSAQPPTAAVGNRAWPWSMTASATSLFDPATLGFGLAPSVEVSRRFRERLFVVLDVTGPVVGHTVISNVASARVREVMATAALAVRVGEGPRAGLDLFVALGPAYVAVHGDAMTPWAAEDSSAWVAATAVGARLAVHLTRRWSLIGSSAALVLVPRPVIDLGPGSYALGQILLLSSLGLDLAL